MRRLNIKDMYTCISGISVSVIILLVIININSESKNVLYV